METKAKFLTTKQMTLIALMTALTCILGPFKYSSTVQSGADLIYKPGVVFLGFLYWEQNSVPSVILYTC